MKEYSVKCGYCLRVYSILIEEAHMKEWKNGGGYIQDLMPTLTAGERELLISGTCDSCWKDMYGEDDE